MTKKIPVSALHLQDSSSTITTNTETREFTGIAYSGKVLTSWYWDRFIIDLNAIQLSEKTPILVDHNPSLRAGFGGLKVVDGNLSVYGTLLSNETGKSVASDSDEGFPWEMSVFVQPGSIEEFDGGTSVVVNGNKHAGPITVLRNNRINEVSFTPIGVDRNTSAKALSNDEFLEINEVTEMPNDDTSNQELIRLKAENIEVMARAEAAEQQLLQIVKVQKEQSVNDLVKELGVDPSEDARLGLMDLSAAAMSYIQHAFSEKQANIQGRDDLFSLESNVGNEGVLSINPQLIYESRRA